jgi:hypothetical protein
MSQMIFFVLEYALILFACKHNGDPAGRLATPTVIIDTRVLLELALIKAVPSMSPLAS